MRQQMERLREEQRDPRRVFESGLLRSKILATEQGRSGLKVWQAVKQERGRIRARFHRLASSIRNAAEQGSEWHEQGIVDESLYPPGSWMCSLCGGYNPESAVRCTSTNQVSIMTEKSGRIASFRTDYLTEPCKGTRGSDCAGVVRARVSGNARWRPPARYLRSRRRLQTAKARQKKSKESRRVDDAEKLEAEWGWTCWKCDTTNAMGREMCRACSKPRPEEALGGGWAPWSQV